jgi:hypothetical protein
MDYCKQTFVSVQEDLNLFHSSTLKKKTILGFSLLIHFEFKDIFAIGVSRIMKQFHNFTITNLFYSYDFI